MAMEHQASKSSLEKVLNFRDVGLVINTSCKRDSLQRGLLFRSGRPDEATPTDQVMLASTYKLRTIIDLRTHSERIEQAKREFSGPASSNTLVQIPNIEYKEINFNGRAYTTALMYQLSYWNAARLILLYAFGYRREAISVIGTNVMARRGLVGLAEDSLEHCTAEVKAVFDVLSDAESFPVLVHCTQGKDRTGLVTLLVLLVLRVPEAAIKKDYLMSEQELLPEKESRLEEIHSIGLPDEFAGCSPNWVESVCKCLETRYAGIEAYLTDRCGVRAKQLEAVRSILLRDHVET